MDYQPTIGLEIHAELKTRTKMFCDSLNDPDEKHPNHNVCPVCLGHPGTLPTINKKAVESVIKVGLALGGKINPITKFDRKNYFYPDLPKGYQISQYDMPIVVGGTLNGIRIRRVHLEEDTGTLIHEAHSTKHEKNEKSGYVLRESSLVDYNRAGVPLMELVTEPDFKSADEVVAFAKELQLILRYLGVSDADMERGQMRIEANVSLSETADGRGLDADQRGKKLGTKTELKNINSFKAVGAAIAYELKRQEEILEKGEKVTHETRGWDDAKQKTVSQRSKEEAHDYRYFPEPDLPPIETNIFDIEKLKDELLELPAQKRARFAKEYGLSEKQSGTLIGYLTLADYFEKTASELKSELPTTDYQLLMNYLTSDLVGLMNKDGVSFGELKINPEHLAHLVLLIEQGKIGSRQAKNALVKMFETGMDPEDIVKSEGMETVSDAAELEAVVREVVEKNPKAVEDYKKGKAVSMQFLIGQAMARLKGRGNPGLLRDILKKYLE
jgi:aspartyl-tRNA(Asn)/glutamyl-tRNA(Gln) amidotransferase subunit B